VDAKKSWLKWVPLLLGILVLLTPYIIAPVCAGFLELKVGRLVPMKCHWTAQAELLLGGMLVLTSLLLFTKVKGKSLIGIFIAILGLGILLLPQQWVIGVCLSPEMSCRTTLLWLVGEGLLVMASGVLIWKTFKEEC